MKTKVKIILHQSSGANRSKKIRKKDSCEISFGAQSLEITGNGNFLLEDIVILFLPWKTQQRTTTTG